MLRVLPASLQSTIAVYAHIFARIIRVFFLSTAFGFEWCSDKYTNCISCMLSLLFFWNLFSGDFDADEVSKAFTIQISPQRGSLQICVHKWSVSLLCLFYSSFLHLCEFQRAEVKQVRYFGMKIASIVLFLSQCVKHTSQMN